MKDDVPENVKKERLQEVISTFHAIASVTNQRFIGSHQLVLVENVNEHFVLAHSLLLLISCR